MRDAKAKEKKPVNLLRTIKNILWKLKKDPADEEMRKELYAIFLNFTDNSNVFIVDQKTFYEIHGEIPTTKLGEGGYAGWLRLSKSADNKYDEIIVDLFTKILNIEECGNTGYKLRYEALTTEDLKKLGVNSPQTEKQPLKNKIIRSSSQSSNSSNTSNEITHSSSKTSSENLDSEPHSQEAEKERGRLVTLEKNDELETGASLKNKESKEERIEVENIDQKIDRFQSEINKTEISPSKKTHTFFNIKNKEAVYPIQPIIHALEFVKEYYLSKSNPAHCKKICALVEKVKGDKATTEEKINSIKDAQSGIGYGRLNAALKRILIAINKNEKIDVKKIKDGINNHDPATHNLIKRIFK